MSDAIRSEPRMTRSRARALGATPVKLASELFADIKSSAKSLLGKSKGKQEKEQSDTRSLDVGSNLFEKEASPPPQEDANQEYAGRDQDATATASMDQPALLCPVAPQDSAVDVAPTYPSPAPVVDPEEAAEPTVAEATPVPAASPMAFDAMAISPPVFSMADAQQDVTFAQMPEPGPGFGTPVDVDYMAASPMQLTSPAVMAHMSDVMEDSLTPQQPMAEDFSFELSKSEGSEPISPPSYSHAEPAAVAHEPSAEAMAPASPAAGPASPPPPVAAAPAPVEATTPVQARGTRAAPKTPRSAGVQGAAARPSTKPPLTAIKPSAAFRTSAAQRVPVVRNVAAEPKAAATAAAHTQSVTPARAGASGAETASKTAGPRTAKRVSIATPVGTNAVSTATRAIVRTPYPRSGSKTPVTWSADTMDSDNAPQQDAEDHAGDMAATTPVPAADAVRVEEAAEQLGDPARLVDATMQLAAALPPSYRTTCEEAPASDAASPLPVAAAMNQLNNVTPNAFSFQGTSNGMEVDAAQPSPAVTLMPGMTQEADGTPEFKPLPTSTIKSNAAAAATMMSTPNSARMPTVGKLFKVEGVKPTTPAATTPKLTIPDRNASYMASTKSFEQKARPLQGDVAAPSAKAAVQTLKPRVKSEAVGIRGDDRSIKQIKREIKAALDAKRKDVKGLDSDEDDEMEEAPYNAVDEAMLVDAMCSQANISNAQPGRLALKGLPVAEGNHVRFRDDGKGVPSPSNTRVYLKGLPSATGSHKRFK